YASEHVHDFFELRLCAEGALDVTTSNGRCRLVAGDAVLLRPGTPHVCGNARLYTGYIIGITPELLHQELAWTLHDPLLSRLLWSSPRQAGGELLVAHLPPEDLLGVQELFKVLLHNSWLAHVDTFEPALRSEQIGQLTLLLARFSRAWSREQPPGAGSGNQAHPSLVAALRLLEKDPAHSWSLAELAGKLGMERSYLIKLFHQTLGIPPIQYLFRSRLELAARLLTGGNIPAGEIAGKVGWTDQTLFCRHFRNRFGMTPLQYRKQFNTGKHAISPPPQASAQPANRQADMEPQALRREPAQLPPAPGGVQLAAIGQRQLTAGETWHDFPAGCHGVAMVDFGRLTTAHGKHRGKAEIIDWRVAFCHPAAPPEWRALQNSRLRWIAWRGPTAQALADAGLLNDVPAYLTEYAANRVMDAWHKLLHLMDRTDPVVAVERQAILLEMLSGLACPEGVPSHYAISG
ncbi:MAG: AraC family transcriptional regulator, partial [Lentisphaeria bacterium]